MSQIKHIGLLNFPGHMNHGANLTAYALQHTLIEMGHRVANLHLHDNNVPVKNPKYTDFADRNIIMSEVDSWGEYTMQRYNSDFDTFIVGSDQVWRYVDGESMFAWKNALEPCFYLGFAEPGKRRIAMAASFGRSDYSAPEVMKKRSEEELKRFAAISVREASAVNLVKQIADVEVTQVIDPVFFLTADDWNTFARPISENKTEFIAYNSFFSHKIVQKLEENLNKGNKFKELLAGNTSDWLADIRDARFVISDSYHVCCFCLIYGTPFAALTENELGKARFVELSEYFDFSPARIIDIKGTEDLTEVIKSIMNLPFDHKSILKKIMDGRDKTYNWLKEAIATPVPKWSGAAFKKATVLQRWNEKYTNSQWKRQQHFIIRYLAYKILYYTCPMKRQIICEKYRKYRDVITNFSW